MLVSSVLAALACARLATCEKPPVGPEAHGEHAMARSILTYAAFSDAAYCPYNFDAATPNRLCDAAESNCTFLGRAETVHEFGVRRYVAGNVAVSHSLRRIVVGFRGTASVWDLLTDISYAQVPARDICRRCSAHGGFLRAFSDVKSDLLAGVGALRRLHPDYGVVVTGHSLGGAVATLAAAYLRNRGVDCDLFAYGSPRVGDRHLADYVSRQPGGVTARVTSRLDPVAVMPSTLLGFRHVYPEYWFRAGFSRVPALRCDGPEVGACSGRLPTALLHLSRRIPMHFDYWARSNPCPAFRARQMAELRPDELDTDGLELDKWQAEKLQIAELRALRPWPEAEP